MVAQARALTAFRSRDFRLLWSGQTVSMIGDAAFVVALGWRAFSLSGSGALGLVLTLQAVGMLATLLVGGALADRVSRRALMVASDIARAALVAGLAGAEALGDPSTALLGGLALAMGLASGFFMPAFGGIVPLVVEAPQLGSANALIGISRQLSLVVGPALAGILFDPVGPAAVFALDAVSFLVSAALVLAARPRAYEREESPAGPLRSIGEGIRYVASERWLWVTIALFSLFLMVVIAPVQVLMPEIVDEHFDRGVRAYGLFFSAQGLGMICGALLFAHLDPHRRRGVLSYLLWTANAVLVLCVVLSPWFTVALGLAVLRGACLGFGIATWDTMLMQLVPEGLLARVISVDYFGSLGLMPLGLAFAAAAGSVADPRLVIGVGAAATAVLFAAMLPARWLRAVD